MQQFKKISHGKKHTSISIFNNRMPDINVSIPLCACTQKHQEIIQNKTQNLIHGMLRQTQGLAFFIILKFFF